MGYSKLILKSDGEPSIKSLKESVKAEAAQVIEIEGRVRESKDNDRQIITEESAAYDSKSNGKIERYIQTVQGQIRSMKDSLEWRLGERVNENHSTLPWMIRHASFIINRFNVGQDGTTPYERWKQKKFKG